jgi:hypothetical protein
MRSQCTIGRPQTLTASSSEDSGPVDSPEIPENQDGSYLEFLYLVSRTKLASARVSASETPEVQLPPHHQTVDEFGFAFEPDLDQRKLKRRALVIQCS